ncbi:hypothetical protein D3C80_515390 [compost metagenome]
MPVPDIAHAKPAQDQQAGCKGNEGNSRQNTLGCIKPLHAFIFISPTPPIIIGVTRFFYNSHNEFNVAPLCAAVKISVS